MSKYVASIPLGDIDRIRIYINSGKLSLRQIVAQEAPDLAITGNFCSTRPTAPHAPSRQTARCWRPTHTTTRL